jgi:hypothetical protein
MPFGAWSPFVTGQSLEYMHTNAVSRRTFSVLYLEGIAFALSRDLWRLVGSLDVDNYLGFGQDLICCITARRSGLKNILDGHVELHRPHNAQYDVDHARNLMFACLEKKFGRDWNDEIDWWNDRTITFKANVVSEIRLQEGRRFYSCPFSSK